MNNTETKLSNLYDRCTKCGHPLPNHHDVKNNRINCIDCQGDCTELNILWINKSVENDYERRVRPRNPDKPLVQMKGFRADIYREMILENKVLLGFIKYLHPLAFYVDSALYYIKENFLSSWTFSVNGNIIRVEQVCPDEVQFFKNVLGCQLVSLYDYRDSDGSLDPTAIFDITAAKGIIEQIELVDSDPQEAEPYLCPMCHDGFKSAKDVQDHVEEVHSVGDEPLDIPVKEMELDEGIEEDGVKCTCGGGLNNADCPIHGLTDEDVVEE